MGYLKRLIIDMKNLSLYKKSIDLRTLIRLIKMPFLAVRKCILYLNATFKTVDNKTIVTINKYDSISLYIFGRSDLYCILEVFYFTYYNININHDAIVIDIGLNIGTTSLFFAQYKNIKHIYAFEPFKDTYEQAMFNINLNKNLKDKITIYNYGLSDKDEVKDISYSQKFSGSMSVLSENSNIHFKSKDMHLSTVHLKSAEKEIQNIISNNTKHKIILKMDCEGSEYSIINSLNEYMVLRNIDYILLEWHMHGPTQILNILKENNFVCLNLNASSHYTGIIYAIREK
jgi:FkbM family methyltransferase